MIRRVNFRKAILAGTFGAIAWELALRLLLLAAPLADITRALGTLVWPNASELYWWPTGLLLHIGVGSIWAIFYAYFFWSTFDWPPAVQGMVFSALPAVLALLIMMPQIELMHPRFATGELAFGGFDGGQHGWGKPVGIFLGHLIYGAVMGSLYTRPVGRSTQTSRKVHV